MHPSFFSVKTLPRFSVRVVSIFLSAVLLSACAPKIERQFKQGCKDAGGNKSFCSCVYTKLDAHYGTQTLKDIEDIHKVPADFNERGSAYTLQCLNKLK